MCLRRLFRETILGRKSGQLALGCRKRGKRANHGECQPVPRGTKGHRIGRSETKKVLICPPASGGWRVYQAGAEPGPGSGSGGMLTSSCWDCLCDLGPVTEPPRGPSVSESATQVLCELTRWSPSITGTAGGRCRVQSRWCRKSLERGLLPPSTHPASLAPSWSLRPPLPSFLPENQRENLLPT